VTRPFALVVGGGPAGLMAADVLAIAGHAVLLAEAMPTIGRKFLMAGKSGLNLTKAEDPATFAAQYDGAWLAPILAAFGPAQVMDWARGLGQPVFAGSSGRVFPVAMKASPLLRAWAARLVALGVDIRTRWRWQGGGRFATPAGPVTLAPAVTVLALGGGSWRRLGSDGAWVDALRGGGVQVAPFQPSNVGLAVAWSPHMARHFGQPLKPLRLTAGALQSRGELVISARGLEGGGLYPLTPALRQGVALTMDLAPDLTAAALAARLARAKPGDSRTNRLRKAGLSPAAIALLRETGSADPKAVVLTAPLRPLDEAISTAGGIARAALTDDLELRALPGVFAAGEMLDWDAPTGGYLLTACLATGRHAGRAAALHMAALAS
jgi:hypothetical protein